MKFTEYHQTSRKIAKTTFARAESECSDSLVTGAGAELEREMVGVAHLCFLLVVHKRRVIFRDIVTSLKSLMVNGTIGTNGTLRDNSKNFGTGQTGSGHEKSLSRRSLTHTLQDYLNSFFS